MITANDEQPLIGAIGLAAGYRGRPVVTGVDIEIRRGDLWFLVGANGTGKTTFVRTVLGLIPPLAGKLSVAASLVSREAVGFVPQRSEVAPSVPMTLREFVRLGLVGVKLDRSERRQRTAEALAVVDLAGRERDAFASLSGGMRQRAVLARALVRRPQLLVLDEPTNHLDPAAEDAFLALLQRLNRENETGTALMFVTHDLDIVERMATHVALFVSGKVVTGDRATVLTDRNLSVLLGRAAGDKPDGTRRRLGGHG
jgi:ABC-type Mn2+/Zn2+ transport system ATPase subunit